jgi:hypothetical protein
MARTLPIGSLQLGFRLKSLRLRRRAPWPCRKLRCVRGPAHKIDQTGQCGRELDAWDLETVDAHHQRLRGQARGARQRSVSPASLERAVSLVCEGREPQSSPQVCGVEKGCRVRVALHSRSPAGGPHEIAGVHVGGVSARGVVRKNRVLRRSQHAVEHLEVRTRPSSHRSFGQFAKKLPQLCNRPHELWPCFQVPTDSQGLWGAHEQYLSDPWAPGHAVLCVWNPERRSFTHSKSHARLLSVRFFPEPIGEVKTIHVGGRTDTTNRLGGECKCQRHMSRVRNVQRRALEAGG